MRDKFFMMIEGLEKDRAFSVGNHEGKIIELKCHVIGVRGNIASIALYSPYLYG